LERGRKLRFYRVKGKKKKGFLSRKDKDSMGYLRKRSDFAPQREEKKTKPQQNKRGKGKGNSRPGCRRRVMRRVPTPSKMKKKRALHTA